MIRILASAVVKLIANSIGLIAAAILLDNLTLNGLSFFVALFVFTGAEMLVEPLIRQSAMRRSPALLGSTALVATLVALIVTVVFTDGMQISGGLTWVMATVIVWLVSLSSMFLLPFVIFKRALAEARTN